jgi:hypothetical protein
MPPGYHDRNAMIDGSHKRPTGDFVLVSKEEFEAMLELLASIERERETLASKAFEVRMMRLSLSARLPKSDRGNE